MNLKALRQKLADLVQSAREKLTLAEKSENAEEKQKHVESYDGIMVSVEQVKVDLERAEKLQAEENALANFAEETPAPDSPRITGGHVELKPYANIGEMCIAVKSQVAEGVTDPRLKYQAATGASGGVASDGGYLVQQDMSAEILKNMYDIGGITSRVRRMPISGNANGINLNAVDETSRANGSRLGGIRGYWLGEAGAMTNSKPKFREMNLRLRKVAALLYATDELLEDSSALSAMIQQDVPEELNFVVEDAIMNGDGSSKPKGYAVAGGGSPLVTVAKENSQTANTIVIANILKMYSRMWARSRANSVWLINQDIEPQLHQLGISDGIALYLPPGGLNQTPNATLLGRPVIPVEYCETLGTAGDIQLVDLSQYLMIDKGGIQSASSIHVQFLTNETAFRFVYRVDGQPIWNSPLTPFKGTSTVSPFIRLATRA